MLEKFPTVRFIGHAQTWWGNIDRSHDQAVMYPKTKVSPGGITDRLLSDYPNLEREDILESMRYASWLATTHEVDLAEAS